MPVAATKSSERTKHRGSNWSRDEIILAFACYREIGKVPEEHDTRVVRIAEVIHRTPDAVVYKIANLRFLDTRGKRGFEHIGQMDKKVWSEFKEKDDKLRHEAERVLEALGG